VNDEPYCRPVLLVSHAGLSSRDGPRISKFRTAPAERSGEGTFDRCSDMEAQAFVMKKRRRAQLAAADEQAEIPAPPTPHGEGVDGRQRPRTPHRRRRHRRDTQESAGVQEAARPSSRVQDLASDVRHINTVPLAAPVHSAAAWSFTNAPKAVSPCRRRIRAPSIGKIQD
jgi:hypothetical protein